MGSLSTNSATRRRLNQTITALNNINRISTAHLGSMSSISRPLRWPDVRPAPTTAFDQSLHNASIGGDCCAAGLVQTLSCVLPVFASATKGGTFNGAGQSYRRDLCHHIGYRPSSNRQPRMLVSQTDPFHVASPLNPIFMLGGAPEAHEVLSKTPRIDIPAPPQESVPRRFRSRLATIRE
jgi:hypothetical protein